MFKPGVSGNPAGAAKLPEEIKAARKLTRIEFETIVNKYLYLSEEELNEKRKDKTLTLIEMMVLSIVQKAIVQGDEKRLDFLLDRMIGKVVQPIEYVPPPRPVNIIIDVTNLDLDTLRQLERATEKDVTPKPE